jgi:hypothetical protein
LRCAGEDDNTVVGDHKLEIITQNSITTYLYFKEINAAKAILADPDKRAKYDQSRGAGITNQADFGFDWTVWASGRAAACR